MHKVTLAVARHLSNDELLARLKTLAGRERNGTVELIAHLAELETRRLHLAAGYPSMFAYCREALRLSEHEAYHRILAARTARRFPVILGQLVEGTLTLTTVKLLAPHLTPRNHAELLDSARGLGRREVERLVARLAPVPDVPASVRKLPAPTPASPLAPPASPIGASAVPSCGPPLVASSLPTAGSPAGGEPPLAAATAPSSAPLPHAVVSPLSAERYRLQLTIGSGTLEKLQLARDLLSHAVPAGDDAAVLDRALAALIAELTRKKFAATHQPQTSRGAAPGSRGVPAEVKRRVFLRDMGRCAFVGKDGRRCNERGSIQFHHLRPYAHGGPPTLDNVALRCRRHNNYEWWQLSTELRMSEGPPSG